jgi:pimeloyl-ACP methyl ester carboxylesterase
MTAAPPRRFDAATPALARTAMPVVQLAASQLSVHYTDSGAQAALPNPVLLLHANPGSSEDFAGIRAQLEEKGYRVIALVSARDLRQL